MTFEVNKFQIVGNVIGSLGRHKGLRQIRMNLSYEANGERHEELCVLEPVGGGQLFDFLLDFFINSPHLREYVTKNIGTDRDRRPYILTFNGPCPTVEINFYDKKI